MKLPAKFSERTIFIDVEGVPVTLDLDDLRCLNWEDRDAPGPTDFSTVEMGRHGKKVTEHEFRDLVHRCHTMAMPSMLVRAAMDLGQRERDYAELRAQGLTEHEIKEQMAARAAQRRAEDPETLTIRTITAAQRSARGT